MRSFKKKKAKTIVEIGPKLPKIEKVEAPNRLIASDTRNEGIMVENIAIAHPK